MSGQASYSRWDQREEYLYFIFLRLKEEEFKSYASRKSCKVFDYFAHLVGSRDRLQVKSHHQKLMLRHRSIRQFLEYYQSQHSQHIPHYQSQYVTPKIRLVIQLHLQRQAPSSQPLSLDEILPPAPQLPQQSYNFSQSEKTAENVQEKAFNKCEQSSVQRMFWDYEDDMSLLTFPIAPLDD